MPTRGGKAIASDPPLLPSQLAVKSACDEILKLKRVKSQLSFITIPSTLDPGDIQERLRASSIGDLMLGDGDSLSVVGDGGYHRDLELYVGDSNLIAVEVRAWGWTFAKYRIDPEGPQQPPYDVLAYPGEKDWARKLDVRLWYSNAKHSAAQEIGVTARSFRSEMPGFERNVVAPAYAETGYEGHNGAWRGARDEREVVDFLRIAQDLFAARQQDSTSL